MLDSWAGTAGLSVYNTEYGFATAVFVSEDWCLSPPRKLYNLTPRAFSVSTMCVVVHRCTMSRFRVEAIGAPLYMPA